VTDAVQSLRDEVADLVERVDALNEGTYMLAGQVEVLGDALSTMNDLKVSQEVTAAKVDEVAEHAVTQAAAEATARRLAAERRRSTVRVWLAVAALVVVSAVGAVLIAQGRARQQLTVTDQQQGCERTQGRIQIEIAKERALSLLVANPKEAEVHSRAADALLRSLVDCKQTYKP
jgi:hypothetical protein